MRLVSPLEYLASLLVRLHLTEKSAYSARDYASLIVFAAKGGDYVETVSKAFKSLPDVDTLFANLKPRNTLDDLEDALKAYVAPLVKPLKSRLPHRRFTIAIDITYQPYYGEKPNQWIHPYKPVKGATGCYKFIVVSIVSYTRRFILLALPLPLVSRPLAWYAERLLDFILPLLPVGLVLMDRGFYDFKLFHRLQRRRLRFIVLSPQKQEYQGFLDLGDGVYPYSSTFSDGKTRRRISFLFAVARGYQGYDWLFATNLRLMDVRSYVHVYKARWGIETVFRVQDEVMIKSKSKDMRVRYFLFLVEALLYDLWQFYKGGVAMGHPFSISFSSFVLALYLTLLLEALVDAVLGALRMEAEDRRRVVLVAADRLGIPKALAAP
jgi:hypothetical protein